MIKLKNDGGRISFMNIQRALNWITYLNVV